MTTNNAWNSPAFSAYQAQNDTGFASWTGVGVYYSIAGTDFTLERGGSGYIKTTPVSWVGSQTVAALSAGSTHYIYIDSSGTIGSTTTRTVALYEENIVLFEVLVDSDTPANVIVVKENHPIGFPANSSEWAHIAIGSVIANINNGANMVLNGTTGVQINGEDILLDHGLDTTIPDSAAAAVTWHFMYTDGSGKWVEYAEQTAFPGFYNNAGTPTALAGNNRAVFRCYASKDDLNSSTPSYFAVMHTANYASLNLAQAAIASGIAAASNELYGLELVQLGYVIFSAGVIEEIEIAKETARFFSASGTGTATTANLISVNTANFDGILSAGDTTVQIALDTIDDIETGMTWTEVTGTSQAASGDNGYIANNGALVTITLPATSAVGEIIRITGKGTGGWRLAQNAGQTIYFVGGNTTTGAGGRLDSTDDRDSVEIICVTADTDWNILSMHGAIGVT